MIFINTISPFCNRAWTRGGLGGKDRRRLRTVCGHACGVTYMYLYIYMSTCLYNIYIYIYACM